MSREARLERKLGDLEVLKKTIEELPRTLSKNVHVPLCEVSIVPLAAPLASNSVQCLKDGLR